MIDANEFLGLLLCLCVMIFIFISQSRLRDIPNSKILLAGFYMIFLSWVFMVWKSFFLGSLFHIFEHLFNLISVILLVIWSWRVFGKKERLQ